jgi:L-lysine exporter family protein LysE/ArgO
MEAFIHGTILSLGLILPLGVQNLFVFNQGAMQPSLWGALPAVVTASLCDTLLIVLAVMGVSLMILQFAWLKLALLAAGFVFLVYMGWVAWHGSGVKPEAAEYRLAPSRQILFAASVSLLNPHAILDTIGVIGASSLHYAGTERFYFTLASVLVSWAWFSGLALAGQLIGQMDNSARFLTALNKLSAFFIWLSALYMAYLALSG